MKTKILCILLALLIAPSSYARFKKLQDVSLSYDFYNRDLVIHKDGTNENVVEFQIELLKQQARDFAAKYTMTYNGSSSSIEILEAKTIFQGKEYKVSKNMIEDKPVANNLQGFDTHRQIAISFPKPELGAKIYLKYKEITHQVAIENNFFGGYYFGMDGLWKKSNVTINSAIPLQIKTNNPYKKLSVTTEKQKDDKNYFYKANIQLTEPLINNTTNEVSGSSLNPQYFTYIVLSSIKTWPELGNKLATKYNNILSQPMPETFLKIADAASKEKGIVNQINLVTTLLNEKVQYHGDWRSINGRFIPQDLNIVEKKQLGDCKDFAAITTKILRHLGYTADVSLVLRGEAIPEDTKTLPNLNDFNHAIVKVVDCKGKIYWIDPTNSISMADGIFPDIAGKYSLVLAENKATYEKIPLVSEDNAKTLIVNEVNSNNIGHSSIKLLGETARMLTGAKLYTSNQNIEDWIYNNFFSLSISQQNRINSVIPELNSRTVKPISISLDYKNPNMFHKTNMGKGYKINTILNMAKDILNVDPTQNVHDLYLSYPQTLERKTIIKNIKIQQLANLDFNLTTPFITLSRKCYVDGKDSIVMDKAIIHKSWIRNDELKSLDFKKLKEALKENFVTSVILN